MKFYKFMTVYNRPCDAATSLTIPGGLDDVCHLGCGDVKVSGTA